MSEENILDIAHISFLDMIKVMITLSGAASAKGTLIRNAIKTAERIAETDYPTFEAYLAAIESATNPITMIEGKATHIGDYVFGLKNCPFGPSIKNYTKVFEKMPEGFADFTAEFNKPEQYHRPVQGGRGRRCKPVLFGAPADAERIRGKDHDRREENPRGAARVQVGGREEGFRGEVAEGERGGP